jgi:Spy/CpxP family protein refolding chaperone
MKNNKAGFTVFAATFIFALGMAACGPKDAPESPGGAGHPGFSGRDFGGPGRRGAEMGENEKRHMARMKKELGITDAQEKKLKELRDARSSSMASLSEQLWDRREAVMKELSRPDYSVDKARKAHTETKALSDRLEDNRFEGLLEARKILTDKQIQKISEMRPPRDGGPGAPDAMLVIGGGPSPGPGSIGDMRGPGGGHNEKGAPSQPDADK